MQPQPRKGKSIAKLIIIIVSVVVVLIVLGAVYYVMTLGFHGSPGPGTTPLATYSKTPVTGGWQITVESITFKNTIWDDVWVLIGEGVNFTRWNIETDDLDGGHLITAPYAAMSLGILSVTLDVTDMSGNGRVGDGDYFIMTANPAFSSATTYTVFMVYKPTSARMGAQVTFTG